MYKYLIFLFFFLLFGTLPAFSQGNDWLWGRQGTSTSDMWGIAADNKGNAFITGPFQDTISFGGIYLNNIFMLPTAFLVKFDSLGNIQWAKQSVLSSNNSVAYPFSVCTDAMGNAYITGGFSDTISFGSFKLTTKDTNIPNLTTIFIAKYDKNGNILWAKQSVLTTSYCLSYVYSVTSDARSNVYITGNFYDTVSFGSFTLMGNGYFLVKYDSNGNVLWAKQSPQNFASSSSVTSDVLNNVMITGTPFVVSKYDSAGNIIWAKQPTYPTQYCYSWGNSITTDISGYIYVTGIFNDTVTFGPFSLKGQGRNIFLAKYSPAGNLIWAKQSTGSIPSKSKYLASYSLTSDRFGDIFFSAGDIATDTARVILNDTIIFLNDTLKLHGIDPSIILKLDTSGKVLCSSVTSTGGDDNNCIASSPSGNSVYFGGDIADSITFGKDLLHNNGTEAPFIARWRECEPTLAVENIAPKEEGVKLYPNPNNGIFTINVATRHQPIANSLIEIYNMLGLEVYSNLFSIQNSTFNIDLSKQPSGIYLYRVITETGELIGTGKFVIER